MDQLKKNIEVKDVKIETEKLLIFLVFDQIKSILLE